MTRTKARIITSAEIIIEIVNNRFEVEASNDTMLRADISADDLDLVELVMEIEDALDIEISNNALEKIIDVEDISVGEIINYTTKQ